MASKKSTTISFYALGAAALFTIGYFIWLFLAPTPTTPLVERAVQAPIDPGVVQSPWFQALHPYASLPVKIGKVGRPNPFAPFEPENSAPAPVSTDTNSGLNTNAPSSTVILPPAVPAGNSNLNVNQQ